jgi:hypothetical protein
MRSLKSVNGVPLFVVMRYSVEAALELEVVDEVDVVVDDVVVVDVLSLNRKKANIPIAAASPKGLACLPITINPTLLLAFLKAL